VGTSNIPHLREFACLDEDPARKKRAHSSQAHRTKEAQRSHSERHESPMTTEIRISVDSFRRTNAFSNKLQQLVAPLTGPRPVVFESYG
jgi:septal ring factor EnvC (AmiA/AmiB activator)